MAADTNPLSNNNNNNNNNNNPDSSKFNGNEGAKKIPDTSKEQTGQNPPRTIVHEEQERTIVINIYDSPTQSSETTNADVIGQSANTIAQTANDYTLYGIIINGILLFLTIGLAAISLSQANSATKAAEIADSTFHDTKRYNDTTLARQKLEIDSNNAEADRREIREVDRTRRERKSLEAQITSLNIARKEFETVNEPFLQIINSHIQTLEVGKPVEVIVSVNNLGNYPIRILELKTSLGLNYSPNAFGLAQDVSKFNTYIAKGSPSDIVIFSTIPAVKKNIDTIKTNTGFVGLYGYIKYQNLVNDNTKIYRYNFKIFSNGRSEVLLNANESFKTNNKRLLTLKKQALLLSKEISEFIKDRDKLSPATPKTTGGLKAWGELYIKWYLETFNIYVSRFSVKVLALRNELQENGYDNSELDIISKSPGYENVKRLSRILTDLADKIPSKSK